MEATGIYHLPVLTFLEEKGYFISVINPFVMKKYAKDNSIRGAKTDKLDSIMIANYGIEKWYKLQKHKGDDATYRTQASWSSIPILHGTSCKYLLELTHILDYTMPGIKKLFSNWNEVNGKDKLSDFVERFWHFDIITMQSLDEFVEAYFVWAEKKKFCTISDGTVIENPKYQMVIRLIFLPCQRV